MTALHGPEAIKRVMRTVGSETGLVGLLFTASLFGGAALQPRSGAGAEIGPYPGLVKFCSEHITGAPQKDGKGGAHINWTGYYSTDPPEKVVAFYTKTLGSKNHEKSGDQDTWRFPLDKPERVLSVTHDKGTFPRGQCKPPPESARAIVIDSTSTRSQSFATR